MKNTIPLIVAVVLAAAAVFAVSRMIRPNGGDGARREIEVIVAAKPITANTEITDSMLKVRKVDVQSLPAKAISADQRNLVIGQRVTRTIVEGDYVVLDDVVGGRTLSDLVGEGEWAVPVTFADASLVQFMAPGVEIAILGTFTVKKSVPKMDATEKPDEFDEEATHVVFPCVRILDVGSGDGIRREGSGGRRGGTIIVSLTPQQAATLVAAQRTMDLYPALRRPSDGGAMQRRDVGMVTSKTFENLRVGLETVVLPDGSKK